jgi:hypothetical protein
MGIEILLSIVVFPIAQKVVEKWIDRIATGIALRDPVDRLRKELGRISEADEGRP